MNQKKQSVSYEDAGVSVERGNELVDRIKSCAASTHKAAVMSGLGGFGAMFDFASLGYREPVLVSGTDGVGTKIKLAIETGRHDSIGIDLVAMCVNDLLVQGARPLFFLDYFACSELQVDIAADVVSGIARGCEIADCSLVGGETAEMPGMYAAGDYDLAGFCVGAVEKSDIIDGSTIQAGDGVIALASSGPHSNGYSLIRKLITDNNIALDSMLQNRPIQDHLLEPTTIYVQSILRLMQKVRIKGMAHITGGGLTENIPRILADGLEVEIDSNSWEMPAIFQWLQEQGNIEQHEMMRTFNSGIGMVLIVNEEDCDTTLDELANESFRSWRVGTVRAGDNSGSEVKFV